MNRPLASIILVAALVGVACSTPPTAAPAATSSPAAKAAPTAAPATPGNAEPLRPTPTTAAASTAAIATGSPPAAATAGATAAATAVGGAPDPADIQGIVDAVLAYQRREAPQLFNNVVRVEAIQGDYARFTVTQDQIGTVLGFARRAGGNWEVLAIANGFTPAAMDSLGIPRSLQPG